jgi:uncharacterized protein (TIGR03545 family)
MRFLRLGYIVPRLVVLVLVYLLAEVGCGYLLRWGIVAGGSAAVGAKVDVADARVSLIETQLLVSKLEVTNPKSPLKNLAKVERLEIDLDTAALLRKKLVINYGALTGLEFDTDRETSGALPDSTKSEDHAPSWIGQQARSVAEHWFADLEARFQQDLRTQLQSVALAEELAAKWPQKYSALEASVRSLKQRAKQLETEYETARKNPLRHGEFLAQVPREVAAFEKALSALHAELAALPAELKGDREAIERARQHDQQRLAQLARLDAIDPQALTEYLVGPQVTEALDEAAAWMRFVRQVIPPSDDEFEGSTAKGRGTDVVFVGARPLPDVWVKRLRLAGAARLGGQPLEMAGNLHNWSSDPRLAGKPTTLELKSTRGLPVTLTAIFDRLQETPRDEMTIEATGLALAAAHLGEGGAVELELGPSTAHVTANVALTGEALSGRLLIRQQGVGVTPKIAIAKIGSSLEQSLAARLGNIRQGETEVVLTGTLDAPEVSIHSTLGSAMAQAIAQSASEVTTQYTSEIIARSEQQVSKQLAKIEGEMAQFRAKIEAELAEPARLVTNLIGQGTGSPHIGGLLPSGSLFK